MSDRYFQRDFCTTNITGIDRLTVSKLKGSEWSKLSMEVNDTLTSIDIRSKTQAEALHFMLGQLLGVCDE